MKHQNIILFRIIFVYGLIIGLLNACSTEPNNRNSFENNEKKDENIAQQEAVQEVVIEELPDILQKTLKAHGGIQDWKKSKTLTFTKTKRFAQKDEDEYNAIDLKTRHALIHGPGYDIVSNEQGISSYIPDSVFRTDPNFYTNLYFYFLTIPYVFTDPGLHFETIKTPDSLQHTCAPKGLLISFDDGVGLASNDQYKLFINKKTNRVDWVYYTVTYFSKTKATKWSAIKYQDFANTKNALFATTLKFFKVKDGLPHEPKFPNTYFKYIKLSDSTINYQLPKEKA